MEKKMTSTKFYRGTKKKIAVRKKPIKEI